MKTNYTFLLLFFISLTAFSQDKKLSIDVNYPLAISSGFQNFTGIAGASIKYRFVKSELFTYGASVTFDFLKQKLELINGGNRDGSNYFFYHANGFAEMTIPSAEKIHPFVGAGFTYVTFESTLTSTIDGFTTVTNRNESNPGFNLKLGIMYDFTSSFYMQSYFHYIRSFNKNEFNDETV